MDEDAPRTSQRVKTMLRTIHKAVPLLHLPAHAIVGIGGMPYWVLPGRASVQNALRLLRTIPPLEKRASQLLAWPPISEVTIDEIRDSEPAMRGFQSEIAQLLQDAATTESVLSQLITPDTEHTVAVRLPSRNRLDELGRTLGEIQVLLEQLVVDPEIEGQVALRGFDLGSLWVEVFVGSLLAVRVIGAATWSAIALLKKKRQDEALVEEVKRSSVQTDMVTALQGAMLQQQELLLRAQTEALARRYFRKSDNEKISRIMETIRGLAALIREGAAVSPALSAPDDVAELFPDLTKPLEELTQPQQKELPAHSDDEPKDES